MSDSPKAAATDFLAESNELADEHADAQRSLITIQSDASSELSAPVGYFVVVALFTQDLRFVP